MENIFSFEDTILVGHPTQTLSTSEGPQGICQQTGSFKFSSTNSHAWEELEWHNCPHWVHGSGWWQSSPYQIETTGCPGRRLHHHAYSVTRLCMHTYTCNASDEGDLCHSDGIELLKQSIPPGIFRSRCWDLTPSWSFSASTQIGWSSWG